MAGVEVEFKIISLQEFSRQSASMFSYDLVMGHRWVLGHPGLLAGCAHHGMSAQIPLSEATRLLMNRCSGLLFAAEKLARPTLTAADADFVRRNTAKAELAFGDAVLTAHGQYHWSCRERNRRLQQFVLAGPLPWLEEVRSCHAAGVDFKLHPERTSSSREALQTRHAAVVALGRKIWLWIENQRLGTTFDSPLAYAENPIDKCPRTEPWRNVLVNVKVAGPKVLLHHAVGRHPRQKVFEALTLLLWEPATLAAPSLLAQVQAGLNTRATSLAELVAAYRALWSRVN